MLIIIMCKKLKINPDNIATPFIDAIADILTLILLTLFQTHLYQISRKNSYYNL
jgi:cation transporter-like permease